jgi:hypothetical protein
MATSISNKSKLKREINEHETFKELVEIWFFPRI